MEPYLSSDLPPADPNAPTQPVQIIDPLAHYQPIRVPRKPARQSPPRRGGCCGGLLLTVLIAGVLLVAAYLVFPYPTRLLLLGVDRAADGSFTGRTDTIMLIQVNPLRPDVAMLSIPRDLWVPIAGVGENRINTAHFFAEANQPGSGPRAVVDVVEANFGLRLTYYARVRFDDFKNVVDAMGGIDINLAEPMGGLPAGRHHLNGEQALAFARDRKGTDDFFRMNQGQYILIAAARQMINPLTWPRIPLIVSAFLNTVDTNLPIWEWPRLGLALVRSGMEGIDHRTINREMVTPFVTDQGAQVLLPNWDAIRPVIREMFGSR